MEKDCCTAAGGARVCGSFYSYKSSKLHLNGDERAGGGGGAITCT